jgi:hypothetical protein
VRRATAARARSGVELEVGELGEKAQPEVVVVVVAPGAAAPASVGSAAGSLEAGSAPVSRPLPAHSVLHFDATQVAIVFRAAFVAHSGAASFVFRHT